MCQASEPGTCDATRPREPGHARTAGGQQHCRAPNPDVRYNSCSGVGNGRNNKTLIVKGNVLDLDPDGSGFKLPGWIRIQIAQLDPDPNSDPGCEIEL